MRKEKRKMNKPNVARFFKSIETTLTKHSPEILTGIGIAGMVATTILAVKATPKALKLIEAKKREEHVDKLKTVDTVKVAWKPYIPAAVTGVASVACLIGASSVSVRRNAALAAAYKISETALTEYKEKVVETIGEKKEEAIREKIEEDHIKKNPVANSEVIVTDRGKTLCYDYTSGRYFESDIDHIKKAENKLNKSMIHDMFGYVSLNDFYSEINLPHTSIGDTLGWNTEHLIDIRIGSHIAEDGRPCIVVAHNNEPKYGYDK
jgi:hypothetical protein